MRELYNVGDIKKQNGPDAIRTHDLWFRKPLLYPTELRGRVQFKYSIKLELFMLYYLYGRE